MRIISISTICYCSLFNFCSGAKLRSFNPLWGHCQEYNILQERLLSENRSTFANCNVTLSESICLNDHEKQIQKFVAPEKFAKNHLMIKGKSSRRMRTKPPNRKVRGSQRCISSSPGHWQTPNLPQQVSILSDQTIHFQTTLSSRLQLESSASKPFTSSSTNQRPRPELRTTSPHRVKRSATSEGQNGNFFCRRKVFSKLLHDRLSLSCMYAKNGDAAVTITTKKKGWSAPESLWIEIDQWPHKGFIKKKKIAETWNQIIKDRN